MLRPPHPSRLTVPIAAALLGGFLSTSADARSVGATVRFEPRDVHVPEGAFEKSSAEEADVPRWPTVVRTFHVPDGYEARSARAIRRGEVRIATVARGARGKEDAVQLATGSLAGYGVCSIAFSPARRDSRTGEVFVARSVDLEIELEPRAVAAGLVRERHNEVAERAIHEVLTAWVENPDDVPPVQSGGVAAEVGRFEPRDLPSVEGSAVDMVIVTTDALAASFEPLVEWKLAKGVRTVVRTVEWIDANYPQGHDQPERVRGFLRDAYTKWGTFLALFAGEFDDVTPRSAYNRFFFGGTELPTDQYFACLEGDWNADGDARWGEGQFQAEAGDAADLYPDLFVGRAPVADAAEAAAFVAKSIAYDKSPPPEPDYVEDVCHLAEVLFPPDWEFGDDPGQITLDGKDLSSGVDAVVEGSWTRTLLYQSENALDRAAALAELEAGRHLITMFDHGDATKFSVGNGANAFVDLADVEALTNGDRLSVILPAASSFNELDLECLGEAFVNNPHGGAIAVLGATRVQFPLSAAHFYEEFLRTIFASEVTRFGAASQLCRVPFAALSQSDATPDRWTSLVLMLFGDPELRLWTRQPESLSVSHAASLPIGSSSITVTVTDEAVAAVADAIVCVSDDAGTYARGRTDGSGHATLPLSSTMVGTVDVVVTKPEHLPHESTFSITPVAAPHLALTAFGIDGDGVVDAGETIELDLTVFNGGGSMASAATVTGSVEAGASATFDILWNGVADASRVFIGPDAVNPLAVPFTLDFAAPSVAYVGKPAFTFAPDAASSGDEGVFLWQDANGWHLRWSDGPAVTTVSGTITTDGRIRDTVALAMENADVVTVAGGEASLTFSGTTGPTDLADGFDLALADGTTLTVTDAIDPLGSIGAGGSTNGTIVFDVAAFVRDGQVAYVDLELTATEAGPWTATVPLVLSAPNLEAYVFSVDDTNVPPLSGDGDGVIEPGETVRLTPTVRNAGSGAARGVDGAATAASGITFLDAADSYGDIGALSESSGQDGYVFTVDDGSGTTLELTLTDDQGRVTVKTMEFVASGAPTGLAFTSSESEITLTWDAASETDHAGYHVYRSPTSGSGFAKVNFELLRAGARFVDSGLPFGTVFFYRVTSVDQSGNESAPSPELAAGTTFAQVAGWPQSTSNWVFSSPAVADADDSGQGEVYVGSHDFSFHGWVSDGTDVAGFPVPTGGEIWSTPAVADVDADGDDEIFFTSLDSEAYAIHHDGTPAFGPTANFFTIPGGDGARGAVTVADIDCDLDLEILFGTDAGDVMAFDHTGAPLSHPSGVLFSVDPAGSRIWGPIAVADIDGDDVRELAFTSWNDSLYVIEPDGSLESGFPKGAGGAFRSGPVLGDLDADGTLEILAGNDDGNLYAFDHDGGEYAAGGVLAALPAGIRCVPALANVDIDPRPEIFVSCMDGRLYAFEFDGAGLIQPGGLFADIDSAYGFSASPIVVDVDGDGDFEILAGHRNGKFYGFHHDGTSVAGLPIATDNEIYSTAAAADLDGDGDVDVAFASYDANVYVIDFPGASAASSYEWPTYAGNNFRTSVYRGAGCETSTAVAEPSRHGLALTQSAPNPFASRTSIRFSVPREMEVSLRVYDVAGRLVRTLLDGPESAGLRTVHWDGRADDGQAAAPGVYFYRLESEDRSITRKSVRLR